MFSTEGSKSDISKKITINLSFGSEILGIIREEAKQKNVSLNQKINSILTDYVYFYKRAEEFESVTFPKDYFELVLDIIDERKLKEYFDTLFLVS